LTGLRTLENLSKVCEVLALALLLSQQLKDSKIEELESLIVLGGRRRKGVRRRSSNADRLVAVGLKAAKITGGPKSERAQLDLAVDGLRTSIDFSKRDVPAPEEPPLPVAVGLKRIGVELSVPEVPKTKGKKERAAELACLVALPFLGRAAFKSKRPVAIGGFLALTSLCGIELSDIQRLENILDDPFD